MQNQKQDKQGNAFSIQTNLIFIEIYKRGVNEKYEMELEKKGSRMVGEKRFESNQGAWLEKVSREKVAVFYLDFYDATTYIYVQE